MSAVNAAYVAPNAINFSRAGSRLAIVCCAHDPLGQPRAKHVGCNRFHDQRRLNVFPRASEQGVLLGRLGVLAASTDGCYEELP